MHTQTSRQEPARSWLILADMLWLATFFLTWGLLIWKWNTLWAMVLVPLFAVLLSGLSEFMHQGVHRNLCGRIRWINNLLARVSCAMVGVDFATYRAWHLRHHRVLNTPDDPERDVYCNPAYVEIAKDWRGRTHWGKAVAVYGMMGTIGETVVSVLSAGAPLVRIFRWGIPISIAFLGFWEGLLLLAPVKVIIAWYLPQQLYFVVDFFMLQSRHYETRLQATRKHIKPADQYEITWNLRVPILIELLLLRRNRHADHHEYPGMHWITARDSRSERMLPLGEYLRWWWVNGPRTL